MTSVIRHEWKRGIGSWRFWTAVGVITVLLLAAATQNAEPWYPPAPIPRYVNFFSVSLSALGAYLQAFWPVLMPVVVVLPAGDSLAMDRHRGLDAQMITRVGWTHYLWGKMAGNAVLVLAAVGMAIAATEVLFAGLFPRALPPLLAWNPTERQLETLPYHVKNSGVIGKFYLTEFHSHFLWATPGLYLVLVILVALWASVSWASLSTAAGLWVRQPLLTLAVPMMVAVVGDVVTQAFWRGILVPSVYAGAYLWYQPPAGSWAGLFLYWAVFISVPVLAVVWMLWMRKEWPRSVG